jgi:translocating chain-associated membrane protein 1
MGQEQQLRRMATSRKSTKSPPIFSQEFIMQNHADIMSCVAMLFVAGLMFQVTSPLAAMFVVLQNNVSSPFLAEKQGLPPQDVPWLYAPSLRDLATIFFYTIICIIAHAVIQEYGVDKLQRKVHLSKTKTAKFNESGQQVVFALVSAVFAGYVIS